MKPITFTITVTDPEYLDACCDMHPDLLREDFISWLAETDDLEYIVDVKNPNFGNNS